MGRRRHRGRPIAIRPIWPTSSANTRRPTPSRRSAAIAAAKQAFPAWSTGSIQERANILDKVGTEILARKDEIGRLLSREEGKTLPEGVGETVRAGHIFKFFAGEVLRLSGEKLPSVRPGVDVEITREPIGVVGLITPWNFPIAIPGVEDRAGARLRQHRRVQARVMDARLRVGAGRNPRQGRPAGRRLQSGDGLGLGTVGDTTRESSATSRPSASPARWRPDESIAQKAVARMAKFQLEMGSKNPLVVLDDADLPTAVNVAVQGAYFSTGQRCTASSRLIVTDGIHDRFVEAMTERLASLEGRQRADAGHRHRSGRRSAAARHRPRIHRRRAAAKARRWSSAASASRDRPTATICRRRSSPTPPTRCASRARKSSARSPA